MTRIFEGKTRLALVAVLGVAAVAGAAAPAAADPRHDDGAPVFGCDAPGGRQEAGAVVGAVLGAVVGRNFTRGEPSAGAIGGAVVGGALGSAIGCQSQRDRETRDAYGYGYDHDRRDYDGRYGDGYGGYAPARYERMNQWMVADTRVAIRQGPSDYSPRVATLRGGERFQAVGRVHHGEWIVVADRGAVIGYVPGDRVSPLGRAQYAWGY